MSSIDFFRTAMGQRYYSHTLPELVKQLTRIADALERLAPAEQTGEVPRGDEPQGKR